MDNTNKRKDKDSPLSYPSQSDTDKHKAEKIRRRYRSGVSYKQGQRLYEEWAEYERFWNADHWPEVTPDTEDFPRPVINRFTSNIEQKVAGLTYELPEIYFEPVEGDPDIEKGGIQSADLQAAEILSIVAEAQAEKLELEDLLGQGVRNAATLGNGIWFFPWDNTIIGGGPNSRYVGDIAGYVIDPVDFFPGDPTNPDIQSQPWIILAERRPLSEVKDFYRVYAPDVVDLLQPEQQTSDTQIYDHQKVEQDETSYVDVLHHFWKETREIRKVISLGVEIEGEAGGAGLEETKEVITYETVLNYEVECQNFLLREEERFYEHGLYPFVSFRWYPKRKSFWGKPESKDIIAAQKEVNRLLGISLLSAYMAGLPDEVYKPEHIDENDLEGTVGGRRIKDNSPGQFWSIKYLEPPTPAGHIPELKQSIETGMNEVSGVHEAWSGKAPSADLNASAIIALQEAAGVRIRDVQRRLTKAIREMGELWLAYWKEFYTEPRLYRKVGPNNQVGFIWFTATDYKDMQFDVKVQAGTASPFSKTLSMANLDKLLEMRLITPEEYLDMIPNDIMPQAKRILAKRESDLKEGMPLIVQTATEAVIRQVMALITQGQGQQQPGQPVTMPQVAGPQYPQY
jgi:hypothetical protein